MSTSPLDYRAKKIPTFTELGTLCTHIFLNYFLNIFLNVQSVGSIEVKTLLLFGFLIFHAII
jgi:hypothetical protein